MLGLCLVSLSGRSATTTVSVQDNLFSPKSTTINAGDSIKWVNQGGNTHTTTRTATPTTWDSGDLHSGASFTFKFNTAGAFPYFCRPHQSLGMVGTITVKAVAVNQPPTVAITQPANGANFPTGSTVPIQVTATDSDGTVAKVEFFSNDQLIGSDTNAPFAFSFTIPVAGSYTLTARATDNSGATTLSSPVTISVTAPNIPPQVSIVSPANNATVSGPLDLLLEASASDPDGTIARVTFFSQSSSGSSSLGSDASAPYSLIVSNLQPGNYVFSALAVDNLGTNGFSTAVNVTVVASAPVVLAPLPLTSNGEFQLALSGLVPGKTNLIQGSGNLIDWVNLKTNTASSSQENFIDPASASLLFRFYRVLQLP